MTSAGTNARTHEYELGHSDWELERLRRQAELVDPFTLQFYRDAGISKGMRVLDVGCGAGDTALLLAELVGDDPASAIYVRVGFGQAIRLRAGHAAVDDSLIQIDLGEGMGAVANLSLLELGQHHHFIFF